MNTITAIVEADADGTIRLPVPEELRHGKVEVTATLKAAGEASSAARVTLDRVARRKAALHELRQLGGLRDAILEPIAWQREIRQDRILPGRG